MLKSFALIFILGLIGARTFETIKLPRIVGMLLVGILIGPFCLDLLDENTLLISSDLRKIALVIILIKAGLTLNIEDLKRVGRPAFLLSFLPATMEIIAYIFIATKIFHISVVEAMIIGSILAAVSPAVVVPKMVYLIENKYGTDKAIPQMILAGASLDDVFVIVLFTSFLSLGQGQSVSYLNFLDIPISIVVGVILGVSVGYLLTKIFKKINIVNTKKLILLFGVSLLLLAIESILEDYVSISGLLAVMSCSMYIKAKDNCAIDLASGFGHLWQGFELILFVLVGASVNVSYALKYGLKAVITILLALCIRSIGSFITTVKTNLNIKERIFVVISYLPKATVQAAIGSIPLAMGLKCGELSLSIAVLGILITAPLGALGIDITHKKFLNHNN